MKLAFVGSRWARIYARAFVETLGGNAEAGLVCIKAIVPPITAISCTLFGYSDSRRLEKMLRESIASSGGSSDSALEYTIRFIVLLVEKNRFKEIDSIIHNIKTYIDKRNGVLTVTVESASVVDSVFSEELRRFLLEKTGVAQVVIEHSLKPGLLGGYRLWMGGYYIDASLKGQMEQMLADMESAVLFAAPGGDND